MPEQNEILQVATKLTGEIRRQFEEMQDASGIRSASDFLRSLIAQAYERRQASIPYRGQVS